MDIAAWLQGLGLKHYEPVFRENEIDAEVLPELTEGDLEKLGLPLGPRKKLLKAIAALAASSEPVAAPTAAPAAAQAERRQLTVMFVDLVGSTELSARLDPEDMSTVIRGYQNAVAGEITRFEGHIAKYMGDGVLAYFGYPKAHEDEAERAVRAALALLDAVGKLATPAGEPLAARVGIATGLVVVGELIGEGSSEEQAVVGDTPNLAARLQGVAEPGQVVLAEGTRRLIGTGFELENLGRHALKGLADPVAVFAVQGERAVESRFEARGAQVLPMVGRDQELALLQERWSQAKGGEGQGVLLVGEAGIGKSRIARALLDALAGERHVRVRYQCSPYHTDSALWPVIQQLNHATGIEAAEPGAAKLDKLEALLERTGGRDAAPLIADLLGLDSAARYGPLDLTPQSQRVRTLDALAAQLPGLAATQPVLVILEDAHWIDPTTLELIGRGLGRIAAARVLILITSRPDRQPDLASHAHVTQLSLNRLGRPGVEAIMARLGGDQLPGETIDAIIAHTDGVPLFVEELTKAVLETGETAVPASLHDSLMARLDRLPEAKEIAQIAAAIGREFGHVLLSAIADKPAPTLATALERLITADLVFCRGAPPEATYTFKHALVQDAAYQSLLKSRRQQLHARIAEALEQQFPDVGENQPEMLARHLTGAGLAERAIAYWRRAGELAAGRCANLEAIGHLSKGLELIGSLPGADQHLDEELALRLAIGGPLMAIKGYASPEVERNYGRARALCERLGRSAELFPVLRGLWNCYFPRAEIQQASELATRLVDLAEEQDTPLGRAHACRALGSTSFAVARLADAAEQLARGIALDIAVEDLGEHRAHALLHGEHPGLYCRMYLAWTLWFLGYPDQALEKANAAIDLGQRLAQPSNIAVASGFAAVLASWRREFAVARMRAETTIEIANEHHLLMRLGFGTMGRGAALVGLGLQAEGIAQIRAGLAHWNGTGARLMEPQWFGFIAEAHLQAGQLDEACSALDRAVAAVAATGECSYQAELNRLQGAVLTSAGELAEAAAWLQRAIETAQGQQAKSWELRAATSLARLWAEQGERQKAHDLLAPIYGWFTEGFDTPDLKDAKALLDELP